MDYQPAVEVSMDDKIKLAAFVLVGYLLGRTRKMRLALTIAGAVAGNKLRDESSRDALLGGIGNVKDSVLSSPEIKRLTDEVTSKLVVAGKTAALTAVGKGISSINSTLESQTERLRSAAPVDVLPKDESEEPEEPADEETTEEETTEEEPADEETTEEEPAEDETEEPAEEESKPAPRSRKAQPKKEAASAGGDEKPTKSTRSSASRGSAATRSSKPRTRKPSDSRSAN
jgi:outer membrane biosynthesis protein TonB